MKKEDAKFEHYADLKFELLRARNIEMTKVCMIPIEFGVSRIVTKNSAKCFENTYFKSVCWKLRA